MVEARPRKRALWRRSAAHLMRGQHESESRARFRLMNPCCLEIQIHKSLHSKDSRFTLGFTPIRRTGHLSLCSNLTGHSLSDHESVYAKAAFPRGGGGAMASGPASRLGRPQASPGIKHGAAALTGADVRVGGAVSQKQNSHSFWTHSDATQARQTSPSRKCTGHSGRECSGFCKAPFLPVCHTVHFVFKYSTSCTVQFRVVAGRSGHIYRYEYLLSPTPCLYLIICRAARSTRASPPKSWISRYLVGAARSIRGLRARSNA